MSLAKALQAAAGNAGEAVYIEDTFSTYLYTGNGSTQTITNGIDLAGEGGLVWIKQRNTAASPYTTIEFNCLFDSARGSTQYRLRTDSTQAEQQYTSGYVSSFNTNGFTLDTGLVNHTTADKYASWTFRKAPKFFDVVTWTGNGVNGRQIPHALGSVPGCVICKSVTGISTWAVKHRSSPSNEGQLNSTNAFNAYGNFPADYSGFTDTYFTVNAGGSTNVNGYTYVAYLFAHDAGGFGADGSENVISCGSFTTDAGGAASVTLGYEPQWILYKTSSATGNWAIIDNMRGIATNTSTNTQRLKPNLANAEDANTGPALTATGFNMQGGPSSGTVIYVAIRRPMKPPESGTEVFSPSTYTGDGATDRLISSGLPADFAYIRDRNDGTEDYRQNYVQDRLRGGGISLVTNSTGAEGSDTGWTNSNMANEFQSNSGILVTPASSRYNASSKSYVSYQFRRAPGFMDVVCYTGTGVARTVAHNLTVAPELMIVKCRSTARAWPVYAAPIGNTNELRLNETSGSGSTSVWNSTTPTSSVFSLGTPSLGNFSGDTYVAYLFATYPGVSKVFSYTGTGTTQQINCGFTGGARFVLIKRTDSTGDWYVWDSARGIVAGNDPYLLLNSTAAEVTGTDYIDTYSAGFEISSTAPAAINANGGSFVFLAIA